MQLKNFYTLLCQISGIILFLFSINALIVALPFPKDVAIFWGYALVFLSVFGFSIFLINSPDRLFSRYVSDGKELTFDSDGHFKSLAFLCISALGSILLIKTLQSYGNWGAIYSILIGGAIVGKMFNFFTIMPLVILICKMAVALWLLCTPSHLYKIYFGSENRIVSENTLRALVYCLIASFLLFDTILVVKPWIIVWKTAGLAIEKPTRLADPYISRSISHLLGLVIGFLLIWRGHHFARI